MLSLWTQHLEKDPKAKEDFIKYLKGSKQITDRTLNIIQMFEDTLNKSETSASDYDKPNWDYRQADKNGYRRCLAQFKALFTIDPKE